MSTGTRTDRHTAPILNVAKDNQLSIPIGVATRCGREHRSRHAVLSATPRATRMIVSPVSRDHRRLARKPPAQNRINNRPARNQISATTPTHDQRCTARHRLPPLCSRPLQTGQQSAAGVSTTAGTASRIGNAAPTSGPATAHSGRKGGLPGICDQPVIATHGH
jgi:hypothetical protein